MPLSPSPNPLPSGPPPLPASAPDDYADSGARAIDLSSRPVADSLREIMASSPRAPQQMPPPLPAAAPAFSNRHWTLAVMGLLFLLAAFVLAGESVWHMVTGGLDGLAQDQPERARLLVVAPVWSLLALTLGLGLIFARRWARALVVALQLGAILWSLVAAVAIAANTFPDFGSKLSPYDLTPAWEHLARLAVGAGLSWVLLSLLNHRHVRLTCEAAQPAPDWTDRLALSQRLLFVTMVDCAVGWAGLASYHPWPCWGNWRFDHIPWVWGGAAVAAALAALLVARGRAFGAWLALVLAVAAASSVVVTAQDQLVDEFSHLWGGWAFALRGGLAYSIGSAVMVTAMVAAALRARHRPPAVSSSPDSP